MKFHIKKLQSRNSNLEEVLELIMSSDMNEDIIDEIMLVEMFSPFSLEEIVLAFSEATYLHISMRDFLARMFTRVFMHFLTETAVIFSWV